MAIQTFTFEGLYDMNDVLSKIKSSLTTAGYNAVWTPPPPVIPGTPVTADTVVFESSETVDPLTYADPTNPNNQPYRIRFESTATLLKVNVGTHIQLPSAGLTAGQVSKIPLSDQIKDTTGGLIGVTRKTQTNPEDHFIERRDMTTEMYQRAVPLSMIITVSSHGFVLVIHESARDNEINDMSWIVVQRSVQTNQAGAVNIDPTNRCPVYCYYRIQRRADLIEKDKKLAVYMTGKIIVRERDILTPTKVADPTMPEEDQVPSLPAKQFVSVLDDGLNSIHLKCISGLHTSRYVYPNDELDLMMYTSADVLPSGIKIQVTMYGESEPRQFWTLPSTGANNTLTRFLVAYNPPVAPTTP